MWVTCTLSRVSLLPVLLTVIVFCVSWKATSCIHESMTALKEAPVYCGELISTFTAAPTTLRCSMPTWAMRPVKLYLVTVPPGGLRKAESKESAMGASTVI